MIISFVAIILSGLLGFTVFRRVIRREPDISPLVLHKRIPCLAPVTAACIALVAGALVSLSCPPLTWRLPVWLEQHLMSLVWGVFLGLLTFLLTLMITVMRRSGQTKSWVLLLMGILLIAALLHMNWRLYSPISHLLSRSRDLDGHILQTHGSSCAAAACANLLTHYGVFKTEREMAELLGTNVMGTSPAQIIRGMAKLGIRLRKADIQGRDPCALRCPAMLFVDHPSTGSESHLMVLFGVRDHVCDLSDPLVGKLRIPEKKLRSMWRGKALEVDSVDRERLMPGNSMSHSTRFRAGQIPLEKKM